MECSLGNEIRNTVFDLYKGKTPVAPVAHAKRATGVIRSFHGRMALSLAKKTIDLLEKPIERIPNPGILWNCVDQYYTLFRSLPTTLYYNVVHNM